jgi:hypothetical protein
MEWIIQHYEWLLGGILIPLVAALISKSWSKKKDENNSIPVSISNSDFNSNSSTLTSTNSFVVNNNFPGNSPFDTSYSGKSHEVQIDSAKNKIRILFIDDDTKFKVVTILKKSGWIHTKSIKDISNLDDILIKETDIFFVDIQGVGKALGFKDEGLGLAVALKRKYSNKKLVIYSSESQGDRFHEGLRVADTILSKNAEPYEFQNIVEQYSVDLLASR